MGLIALDPKSKSGYTFTDVDQLTDAMVNYGFIPILSDGSQAKVQEFEGGYLVQGAPLNVWMKGVWYEGQVDILAPFWRSGEVPEPPSMMLQLPVVPMPEKVLSEYAEYKGVPGAQTAIEAYEAGKTGFDISSLLSSPMVLLALGVGAVVLLSGGRRGKSAKSESGSV